MGADQQAGLMRADLTGLAYTYALSSYKRVKGKCALGPFLKYFGD
jgi:hypothetical protein